MRFEFTLAFRHLDFDDETLEQLAAALPEAEWTKRDGLVQADVLGMQAADPVEAALKAEMAVRSVVPYARASHVVEDFVAIPDIALRVGVDREAVRHWVNGTRGIGSFPRPRGVVGDRVKIWDWSSVNAWLRSQGRVIDDNNLLSPTDVARVDSALAALPVARTVGVEMTPDRIVAVVTDDTGRVFEDGRKEIPGPGTPEQAAQQVAALVSEFQARAKRSGQTVPTLLGVNVGGHVDREGTIVLAPRYQGGNDWKYTKLRELLEDATGLPTVVQNDADALAVYERYLGVGQDARTFVVLLLSDGVGAGIISSSELVRGWEGAAGEVGHLVVTRGFECTCGNDDCLECVVGMKNLTRAIRKVCGDQVSTLSDALTLAIDDDRAQEEIRRAGEALGRALSMVVNLINPSHLVLYAPDVLLQGAPKHVFVQELERVMRQHAFSTSKRCEVVPRPREADDLRSAIGAALGALRARR